MLDREYSYKKATLMEYLSESWKPRLHKCSIGSDKANPQKLLFKYRFGIIDRTFWFSIGLGIMKKLWLRKLNKPKRNSMVRDIYNHIPIFARRLTHFGVDFPVSL